MAPQLGKQAAVPAEAAAAAAPEESVLPRGPHPGYVSVANQNTFEQKLRRMMTDNGCDPAREDSYRLQGIQLVDNVREALQ